MFKPITQKIDAYEINHTVINALGKATSLNLKISGPYVSVSANGLETKKIGIADLMWAAEVLKVHNKKNNFVCAEHGPYIAEKGKRQPVRCQACAATEDRNIAAEQGSELGDDV